jgi:hypothetical protein
MTPDKDSSCQQAAAGQRRTVLHFSAVQRWIAYRFVAVAQADNRHKPGFQPQQSAAYAFL